MVSLITFIPQFHHLAVQPTKASIHIRFYARPEEKTLKNNINDCFPSSCAKALRKMLRLSLEKGNAAP